MTAQLSTALPRAAPLQRPSGRAARLHDPIRQGDILWADLGEPGGSEPGYRRPVLVVQADAINRSRITTIICVPLTSNVKLAQMPGNVLLKAADTGLDWDSVASVTLITTIDRASLHEWAGAVPERRLQQVFEGLDLVMGR
jgi:mRNA interferase MazF